MGGKLYKESFCRNSGAISEREQQKLAGSRLAVIGLGGIGGIAFELLVRSGVGHFAVVDSDSFDLTNLNRQVLSSLGNMGAGKAEEAKRFAKTINPGAKVGAIADEFDEHNAAKILRKADAVIDGLDNVLSRVVLSRKAREMRIPYVFGAASGSLGMSSVFISEGYEECMGLPSKGKKLREAREALAAYPRCESILGVVSNAVGAFEAQQALCVLLAKPFVRAPYFAFFDAFGKEKMMVKRL